jgi:hypothetical protein
MNFNPYGGTIPAVIVWNPENLLGVILAGAGACIALVPVVLAGIGAARRVSLRRFAARLDRKREAIEPAPG